MADFTARTATVLASSFLTGGAFGGGGGATIHYINRVYDSVASKFVTWSTTSPDSTGTSYPGPGSFGVTTSSYAVVGTYTV
jgi:hypothetical protein